MFEVDVDIAVTRQSGKTFDECLDFGLRVGACAAQAKARVSGGGVNLGSRKFFAFGDAKRSVVRAKDVVNLFGEPSLVAKLEGDRRGARSGK